MALSTGLQAYWSLSDLTDADGNTYPLTNTGSCTFGSGGLYGDCVTIPSGTNKYLGRTDTCGLTGDVPFTISMWCKWSAEVTVDRELFQLYENGASGVFYRGIYEYNGGSRRVRFFKIDGGGTHFLDDAGNIGNNTWRHIAYTYTGSTQTLYVDNVATSSAAAGNHNAGTTKMNLGGELSNQSLNGLLDEVGLWSRALSGTEIGQLYNSGAGLSYADITGGSINSGFFNLM